jgi:hypothetical protein
MSFSDCMTYLSAASEKDKLDYKTQLSLAWKTAYWQRCEPKKFPELKEILEEVDKNTQKDSTQPQSAQDMFEVVKMLHERMSGGHGKK